ncbi:DUF3344 domain-containing protein [Streptomyces sp. RS10V-4]|uniref:DUF3344 domain-containing protein n=1 Tax=Streptomyces rhizoryzae TaxID=2932493 RepID=UPI002005457D|nr:DUF3344 domain-containing protein [Streptomyces rhizoryzae]MCK7625322.1 DUF3344 domain-containing protein [Streptomyces rhizoryzae]
MRKSMDRTGRGTVCALAALALSAALTSAAAAPGPAESTRIPFAERFHETGHGGIARAANSTLTCRPAGHRAAARRAPSCAADRPGGRPMRYLDVDDDPHTVASSRARLRLPAGARVRYARLYWGGNLLAGGHRTGLDPARVLLAGPGGRYRTVRADGVIGRRTTYRTDAYQASADVTALVRRGGPGAYTVAQVAAAEGRSRAGTWGGWALVAVYAHPHAPLRRLALWDGFEALGPHRRALTVALTGLRIPAGARGAAGTVAYHGMPRSESGISAGAGRITPVALHDSANPANGAMNSTITDFGRQAPRTPAYRTTYGFDSDVFDLRPALRYGGDRLTFRFTTRKAGYLLGALFVQADSGH